jgi:hypothetical protein
MVIDQIMEVKETKNREDDMSTPNKDERVVYEHLYRSDVHQPKNRESYLHKISPLRTSFNEGHQNTDHHKRFSTRNVNNGQFHLQDYTSDQGKSKGDKEWRDTQARLRNENMEKSDQKHRPSIVQQRSLNSGEKAKLREHLHRDSMISKNENQNGSGKKPVHVKSGTHISDVRVSKTDWFVNIINSLDKKLKEIKTSMKKA